MLVAKKMSTCKIPDCTRIYKEKTDRKLVKKKKETCFLLMKVKKNPFEINNDLLLSETWFVAYSSSLISCWDQIVPDFWFPEEVVSLNVNLR